MNRREIINRDGSPVIPAVLTSEKMDQLLEDIGQTAPLRNRACVPHALSLTPVAAVAEKPGLIELVRDVLDPAAFPYRATLFDKSPQSNWLVVWHHDRALPLGHREEVRGWGRGQ